MSRENVETVKAIFDLLNQGKIDQALELLPPDGVYDFSRSINPDAAGIYRGRDEIRAFLGRVMEAWDKIEYVAEEYIEVGDDVIRVGGIRARGAGSGVEVVGKGAQLWHFRDGVPVLTELFQTKADALEAARGK